MKMEIRRRISIFLQCDICLMFIIKDTIRQRGCLCQRNMDNRSCFQGWQTLFKILDDVLLNFT